MCSAEIQPIVLWNKNPTKAWTVWEWQNQLTKKSAPWFWLLNKPWIELVGVWTSLNLIQLPMSSKSLFPNAFMQIGDSKMNLAIDSLGKMHHTWFSTLLSCFLHSQEWFLIWVSNVWPGPFWIICSHGNFWKELFLTSGIVEFSVAQAHELPGYTAHITKSLL